MELTKSETFIVDSGIPPASDEKILKIHVEPALKKANELGLKGYKLDTVIVWTMGQVRLNYIRPKTFKELKREWWNNLLDKLKIK